MLSGKSIKHSTTLINALTHTLKTLYISTSERIAIHKPRPLCYPQFVRAKNYRLTFTFISNLIQK